MPAHPSPPDSSATALRIERRPLARVRAEAADGGPPFAALAYGATGHGPWMTGVHANVLLAGEAQADVWHAGPDIRSGTTGVVRWRTDGQWLLGVVDLGAADEAGGLAALAHRAYANVFQTLAQAGCPHLLRLWNYLPRINAEGRGLERYREFNTGRQQAFLDAGYAAFDGAPAACALGIRDGGLCVRFLAGRAPPVAVENPRQVSAYRYPERYGPRAPTFSRAALAPLGGGEVALFVSGTASIVGHETAHPGDVPAQLAETLVNLRTVIGEANRRGSARFALEDTEPVVYVRHPAHAEDIRRRLAGALGDGSRFMRRAVFLEADICRADLLLEIETHASAQGRLDPP
ncbi:MAG: hypothetical protein QM586_11330 [Xenophilus sp.]